MSEYLDIGVLRCQSAWITENWNFTVHRCHFSELECHSALVSENWDMGAFGCQSTGPFTFLITFYFIGRFSFWVIFRNGVPECYIRTTPSMAVNCRQTYQLTHSTLKLISDFMQELIKKKSTRKLQNTKSFSEHGACPDECCMTMTSVCVCKLGRFLQTRDCGCSCSFHNHLHFICSKNWVIGAMQSHKWNKTLPTVLTYWQETWPVWVKGRILGVNHEAAAFAAGDCFQLTVSVFHWS